MAAARSGYPGSGRPSSAGTVLIALAALAWSVTVGSPAACAQSTDGSATTELSSVCTDRPTKSNAACTVDAGHLQYEADVLNYSHLRVDGTTTDTWLATNPTLKYGVSKTVDVEVNIAPWEVVRTHDDAGDTSIVRGPGDLYTRVKWEFFSQDKLSVALLPYLKAPTARHGIGNGSLESGVIVPVNYQLTDKITLTTVPEFDSLKDADNTGHHFNTAQLVNVAFALPHNLTAYAELWGDWNHDPAGTVHQYSADAALAWALSKRLQVDVGLNAGLNRNTPRIQLYFGVAQKF